MIIELEPWEIKLLRAGLGQLKKRAEKNKKRTPNFIPEHGHNNVNDSRLKGIRTLMERLQYNDMENVKKESNRKGVESPPTIST